MMRFARAIHVQSNEIAQLFRSAPASVGELAHHYDRNPLVTANCASAVDPRARISLEGSKWNETRRIVRGFVTQ